MQRSLLSLAMIGALGAFTGLAAAEAPTPSAPTEQAAAEPQKPSPALAHAQAKLAMELIQHLAKRGEDETAVSPASLASAFGLVGEGASPEMQAAIGKALGFSGADAKKSLELVHEARKRLGGGAGGLFQTADRLVFAPGQEPKAELVKRLQELGAEPEELDLSKTEEVAKIDAWVNKMTQGMIPQILGGPLEKPAFVALNALHFKGKWQTPFDPKLTAPAPFVSAAGKSADVQMMHLTEARRLYRTDKKFVAVDLPFMGDAFSLVVVTTLEKPAASAKEFAQLGEWLAGLGFEERKGDLALPRLKLSARNELLEALDAQGLKEARGKATALADFGKGAMLGQVLQRAAIEWDEEGAEAAAATAVMAVRSMAVNDALHMTVDKPFVFALREKESGLILLAGYVGHAPEGKAEGK